MGYAGLDGAAGAGIEALAAADALRAVGGMGHVYAHGAGPLALAAMDAGCVDLHAIEAHAVEQAVEGAQGAKLFAEGAFHQQAYEQHDRQQAQLHPK